MSLRVMALSSDVFPTGSKIKKHLIDNHFIINEMLFVQVVGRQFFR